MNFEECNICGKHLVSMNTHCVGEFFFCRECYACLVFPFVNLALTKFVEGLSGNKDAQQDFAESFEPGSKSGVIIDIARIGNIAASVRGDYSIQGTITGRVSSQATSDSVGEVQDRVIAGEGEETEVTDVKVRPRHEYMD